jgi:adenylate cyclase
MNHHRDEGPFLICFVDLTRFATQSERTADAELAEGIDAYYEQIAQTVNAAGGRVVKFIGDAALIVFSEDAVDRGVQALINVKQLIDGNMEARGWECRLTARAHFGSVVAGPFGAAGDKRFDLIGRAVITAAKLNSTGITLSETAFRQLGAELQRRFREQEPGETYELPQ